MPDLRFRAVFHLDPPGKRSSCFAFLMLTVLARSQVPSLMIGVYSSLYSKRDRGFRVSCALVASTIGGILTSLLFGKYIDTPESDYRLILWSMSFSAFFCSAIHFFMPPVHRTGEKIGVLNNLGSLWRVPKEDALFGKILVAWMILGWSHYDLLCESNILLTSRVLPYPMRRLPLSALGFFSF